jgi:hypothetical protein
MRRTRKEFLDSIPHRPRKTNFNEVLGLVKRQIKRKAIADGLIVDPATRPPRYQWAWEIPKTATFNVEDGKLLSVNETSGIVEANTKGEARSLIKSQLGLRKKDRLPLAIVVTKVERSAS